MGARLRDIAQGRRDVCNIDPESIKIENGFNPRQYTLSENREHLDALKASIREMGVRVPLLIRWDTGAEQAILIDGECRLRACLELIEEGVEIKTVPVLQEQGANEADRLLLAVTANTGKPLSLIESGIAFRRFVAFGWTLQDIAIKTGKTARYVNEAIELSDAPQEIREMLSAGEVTPALAKKTLREKGDGAVATLKGKVTEAKSKGKKSAVRTRDTSKTDKLIAIGDKLANLVLADSSDWDSLEINAKKWQKARGEK